MCLHFLGRLVDIPPPHCWCGKTGFSTKYQDFSHITMFMNTDSGQGWEWGEAGGCCTSLNSARFRCRGHRWGSPPDPATQLSPRKGWGWWRRLTHCLCHFYQTRTNGHPKLCLSLELANSVLFKPGRQQPCFRSLSFCQPLGVGNPLHTASPFVYSRSKPTSLTQVELLSKWTNGCKQYYLRNVPFKFVHSRACLIPQSHFL
jgi:hypothetical protein